MNKIAFCCLFSLSPIPAFAEALTIASWNIANLHHENGEKMRPWAVPREQIDYDRLSEIAASLEADIFALQEIGSPRAAMRIFDPQKYHILISDRYHEQSVDVPMEERDVEVKGIYTAFAINKERFPERDNCVE